MELVKRANSVKLVVVNTRHCHESAADVDDGVRGVIRYEAYNERRFDTFTP